MPLSGPVPERWKVAVASLAWAWAMRIEAGTWRRHVSGLAELDELAANGEGALVALWHGDYRAVLACVRDRPCALVSTQTYRGRIIRGATRRLGHRCALRPTALRGGEALRWLRDRLKGEARVVLVADGPSGPARRVKRGVVELASELGLRVVPCAAASRWAFERERWDRQEIPLPFSRVAVVVGQPLPAVPAGLGQAAIAAWRERVAQGIAACRHEALTRVGRAST